MKVQILLPWFQHLSPFPLSLLMMFPGRDFLQIHLLKYFMLLLSSLFFQFYFLSGHDFVFILMKQPSGFRYGEKQISVCSTDSFLLDLLVRISLVWIRLEVVKGHPESFTQSRSAWYCC